MLLHDYRSYLGVETRRTQTLEVGKETFNATGMRRRATILSKLRPLAGGKIFRMAAGELFDYEFLGRNDFKKPNKAILLPRKPDLESFKWLGDLRIYFVWKENDVFRDNAKNQFI